MNKTNLFIIVAILAIVVSIVGCASPTESSTQSTSPNQVVVDGKIYKVGTTVFILEEGAWSPFCFWVLDRTGICLKEVPEDGIGVVKPNQDGWWFEQGGRLPFLQKTAFRICRETGGCGWYLPSQFRIIR